jgi:hypothetical protein
MNRHAQSKRRKGYPHTHDDRRNHTTYKAAAVAAQVAHAAPEKAPATKAASQKKGAPKAKKATGAKQGAKAAAPKQTTMAGAKTSKKAVKSTAAKKAVAPRPESKGAKILEMITRAKGDTARISNRA